MPYLVPLLTLTADRVTKLFARRGKMKGTFLRGKLSLQHLENGGLAGGFGRSRPQAAAAAHAMGLLAAVGLLLPDFSGKNRTERTGALLFLSGAASNLYDRLRRGSVTDMLRFPRAPGRLGAVVWNIADGMILSGVALLICGGFRRGRSNRPE